MREERPLASVVICTLSVAKTVLALVAKVRRMANGSRRNAIGVKKHKRRTLGLLPNQRFSIDAWIGCVHKP